MHVYDAELLRVRAHTYTNLDAAPPAFTPPANWPAARARRCSNCVPPSMISSHAASPPVPHSLTLSASSRRQRIAGTGAARAILVSP